MKRFAACLVATMCVAQVAHASSDQLRSRQWGLARIRAPRAWSEALGRGIKVAVIDTGVDATHEDLQGQVLAGRDFVDDDLDPSDEHGHGTLVAGIIAATRGNELGGTGVAPRARIVPVRALDADGNGEPGNVADAIRWTIGQGVQVINLSLTVDQEPSTLFGNLFSDDRVEEAIEDAADAGILVLIASGNRAQGDDETAYDSTRPEVLVIGASTQDDRRAAYSNFGSGLDLVAPGGGSATDGSSQGCRDPNWIVSTWWTKDRSSKYGATCGTSMATAFASGLGALLRGQGLTAAQAAQRMIATAKDLGPPGRDDETGMGRIDAAAAVGAQPVTTASEPSEPAPVTPSGAASIPAVAEPTATEAAQPTPSETSEDDTVTAVPPFGEEPPPAPTGGGNNLWLAGLAAALTIAVAGSVATRRVRRAADRTATGSEGPG